MFNMLLVFVKNVVTTRKGNDGNQERTREQLSTVKSFVLFKYLYPMCIAHYKAELTEGLPKCRFYK